MEITLKTREELGLSANGSTAETGIAKDLFKGLKFILNNRAGVRPSVTFFNDEGKSVTVTAEEALVEPVRTGKITINHLLGFTVIRANNDGLYFLAPKVRAEGSVDNTEVKDLDALSFNDLLDLV
jgi:hypothetical protein